MADFRRMALGDLCELKRGYDLPARERKPGPYPLVSSSGPSDFHAVAKVRGPGVIAGRYGTIGEVFYVTEDFWPLNTALYVRDFKGNDRRFVYYFLKTLDWQKFNDKSGVPGVNRNDAHMEPISVPAPSEQHAIAAVLGALDDRIELNRRMNRTLEAMARALFRSWFVDFDPVHARAEGRAPAHMDPATAALFPARLGEDGLPEGWRRDPLSTICAASRASIDPREHKDALFDHFSIPAFDAGDGPVRQPGAEIMSNKLVVPNGAILFSRLNPSIPRVWWARTQEDVFASVGSTEYLVAQPRRGTASAFLYSLLMSDEFRADVVARVTGTSNSHQRVKPGSVLEIDVVVPIVDVVTAFGDCTQRWFDKVHANLEQSRTLAALRDALLPKLMSGELRVRDAGRRVAEVA